MSIGTRIEELRKRLGIAQDSFGAMIGCSGARISRYERGEIEPSEAEIKAICEQHSVRRAWLMGEDNGSMFEASAVRLNDRESVSKRLKRIRKERGLTQAELADAIRVGQGTISKVETKQADLSEELANAMAMFYHVGEKWLMYGDEKYKYDPVNRELINWLWDHPEVRRQLYSQMNETP